MMIRRLLQGPPTPTHATPKWGGHSLRRTGAREYHRLGVPLPTLQRLGRWSSQAIENYIAGMPFDFGAELLNNSIVIGNDTICITKLDLLMTQMANISARVEDLARHLESQRLLPTKQKLKVKNDMVKTEAPKSEPRRPVSGARMPLVAAVSIPPRQAEGGKLISHIRRMAHPQVGKPSVAIRRSELPTLRCMICAILTAWYSLAALIASRLHTGTWQFEALAWSDWQILFCD